MFNVNDRVVAVLPHDDNDEIVGLHGRIATKDRWDYGVEFDEDFRGGHTLNGEINKHRGWYITRTAAETVLEYEACDIGPAPDLSDLF